MKLLDFIKFDKLLSYLNTKICPKVNIKETKEYKDLEDSLNSKLKKCHAEIKVLKQEDSLNKELLERYPSKLISWNARSFPFSKDKCRVPVQILITPTDPYIIKDLKERNLYQTGEEWETLIPKIYKSIHDKYYKYEYDKAVWGVNEVWEFPYELREKGFSKGFDCDSWGNFIVSYFRAAGLPAGMVWCVAGDTDLGGHHTVYVWSSIDGKFHHMNSTYRADGFCPDMISKYPTHLDAEEGRDKIGIKKVWCSYNDFVARSYFDEKRIGELVIESK